mmetsp:Transcript_90968/g.278465  ORF Transcript_90968/g.278465 Transcript_90968/m.278465 type:complete len:453 (-) Transcript_90968:141-1499(-)
MLLRQAELVRLDEVHEHRHELRGLERPAAVHVEGLEVGRALRCELLAEHAVQEIMRQEGDEVADFVDALPHGLEQLGDLLLPEQDLSLDHFLVVPGVGEVRVGDDPLGEVLHALLAHLALLRRVHDRGKRVAEVLVKREGELLAQLAEQARQLPDRHDPGAGWVPGFEALHAEVLEGGGRDLADERLRELADHLREIALGVRLQQVEALPRPHAELQVLRALRQLPPLGRGGQEVHHRLELHELQELVLHDDAVLERVEQRREAPALLLVDQQRVRLAQALDDGDQLHGLQGAALVDVKRVEALATIFHELGASEVIHQPVRQERQDAPQALLIALDHGHEMLEGRLLHPGELDGAAAVLGLEPTGDDHELHQVEEVLEVDHAVAVRVEHVDEAPALVVPDGGDLARDQMRDDRHDLFWVEHASTRFVQLLEMPGALLLEVLALDGVPELVW